MPDQRLAITRRTALATPVAVAAAAALTPPRALAVGPSSAPRRLFSLANSPLTMAREGSRMAVAGDDAASFLRVLDLTSHRTVSMLKSTLGTQGRCTSVVLHHGWLVWVDQARIPSDDDLSSPWRLYALAPGSRRPVCLRTSTTVTAMLPPTLAAGPGGVWWTEWSGPTTRTSTVLMSHLEAATPAVHVWKKGTHLAELTPLASWLVATETVFSASSYKLYVDAAAIAGGRTVRLSTSGNSYSAKSSSAAVAWVERHVTSDAMVRGALVTFTASGPRMGKVRDLAGTESLLAVCGHHVVVHLSGRLLAIDLTGGRTLTLGSAPVHPTVMVEGRTLTWLEASTGGYTCRESVL